ncbi:tetratricopeptide repeat protein [Flavisolibacter ginsenosidimutans]|nr:tetratricopeptide repeat protein [Flavisolibacter ginsenosidimutans]
MLTKLPLVSFLVFVFLNSQGQIPQEKELVQKISLAKNDETQIIALGELAELYSIFRDNKKADSVLEKQMLLAEISQNDELILKTLSGSVIDNIAAWSSKETFDRATAFLQKCLSYAKEKNNTHLETITHLKLASLFQKRQLYDQAMEQSVLAFNVLDGKQDSLKAALYLELGDAFSGKGDAVAAYKNYNSAYDIAYSLDNVPLQSATWHSFADFYLTLGDSTLAKNALLESLRLNKKHKSQAGLLADYIDLFRLTVEIDFANKALLLANELKSLKDQLLCKRLLFSYIMVVEKNSQKALSYLQQNPDLALYQSNRGLPNYNTGAIYHYSGQYEEAVKYYLLDEPLILSSFGPSVQLSYFGEMADCYDALNETQKAVVYYEKAFALSKAVGSPANNASLTQKLSQLYARENDYKNAYAFSQLYLEYNEALKKQAKQREVTLLGLEREKKQHEKDIQAAAEALTKTRNLQYTGISMAIVFLFVVLILMGMFPVSKETVRMLNFVTFICLFEFITLLIDAWLHDLTHGEPLRIWLAKIVIIALLLPVHHTLEHLAVKFLSSQKLQQMRRRISVRKFFRPSKKTIQKLEENLEEGTLV